MMSSTPRSNAVAVAVAALLFGQRADRAAATDMPVAGAKLAIRDTGAAPPRVTYVARSATIDASGDPSTNGGSVQLVNPNSGEASSAFAMPAQSWTCRKSRCRYRDKRHVNGPVEMSILKTGFLRIVAAGAELDYPVMGASPQESVGVNTTIGANRYCALFGGRVRKDNPRRGVFVATNAPAPTVCATPGSASTTTTTLVPAIPLSGCASSGYAAATTIGDARTFQLIVDSGSGTLGVASRQCANCGMLAPVYTPGATAISLGGHPSALYGDKSSWSGRSFSDVVSVGGVPDVRMSLAAIDSQSGFFVPASCEFVPTPNGSQGILGLGGAGITVGGTDSYIDRSASAGVFPDVFSVQLCATGGRMWLGGYDATSVTTAPAYTPLVTASPYYAVTIADLAVGGTSLGFGAADFGATLVDTGTTVMQLPSAVYSALTAVVATNTVFQQNFGDASSFFGGSTCYLPAQGLTKSQLDQALPALALTFPSSSNGTFMVTLPPTDSYLLEQQDTQGHAYYCPGVAQGPPTIVGANALHTLLAVFDREHSQIGFAPEQGCSAIQALARSLRPSAGVQAGPPVSSRPMPPYRHHRRAE